MHQPQGPSLDNPYQKAIKKDVLLDNKSISSSQYQDGDSMTYSKKKALKQISEASSWPNFSCLGEYDHMGLIDSIYGLFIDVPSIPEYWITASLNTALKGHASICYTEMKKNIAEETDHVHRNGTWIWQKTMSLENDKYSVNQDPYEWYLRKYTRIKSIDTQMNI
ncbi:hypothetical protein O181_023433 [Austropuccinia psidii MF-1]|uniref:Uncharacterized protein n=1 Tax=Austropuccinia psidii MF-1 TaxID=1389203 RepID=A0A9Q3CIS4_9BASI|nr:hypothetical protein [Austropuccinia psidii MF-1]